MDNSATPTIEQRPGRYTLRGFVNRTLLYGILTFGAIVAIIPFFWMASNSLMTIGETINKQWLPGSLQFDNYRIAWEEAQFGKYFMNSVIITFTTIIGLLVTSILAAYAFARIRFVGSNLIFTLLLATLMIPESVILIPNFLMVRGEILPLPQFSAQFPALSAFPWLYFGGSWINTLASLSVPFMGSAFSIFLLRQFFITIPDDLWDSAQIDGAGHLRFLVQICLPISRPAIMTVTLLTFIGSWNAFLWPLIVTTKATWRPLMVGLWTFVSEAGPETHLLMAGAVITIVPMLVLYFITQKSFTEGIATTGLKG